MNTIRARTWREAKQELMTRQSQILSGPKSATNEFGSAVAVATVVIDILFYNPTYLDSAVPILGVMQLC